VGALEFSQVPQDTGILDRQSQSRGHKNEGYPEEMLVGDKCFMRIQEPTHCPHRRQVLVIWIEFRGDHSESHKDSKVNSSNQSFYRI
jgi:hypothetical protein